MNCCLTDLREKEVINLKDGCRLGCVCDVEIDSCTGRLVAIIIFGKANGSGSGPANRISAFVGRKSKLSVTIQFWSTSTVRANVK